MEIIKDEIEMRDVTIHVSENSVNLGGTLVGKLAKGSEVPVQYPHEMFNVRLDELKTILESGKLDDDNQKKYQAKYDLMLKYQSDVMALTSAVAKKLYQL